MALWSSHHYHWPIGGLLGGESALDPVQPRLGVMASELPLIHIFNVLVEARGGRRTEHQGRSSSFLCDPSLCKLMTGMRPLPLLSRLPSLPAGHCLTVTDVGMRCAAKCPRLCVQSWMLISISSIPCSNTDLSHSRALSLVAFYPLRTLHQLPLGTPGQIVWCFCGSW